MAARRLAVEPGAALGHFGIEEFLEDGARFASLGDHRHAALLDRDAGGPGDVEPDVARAPGPAPDLALRLTRHRHEAEIAHRRAIGLGVAVDDQHAQAAPRRRERMRQPDDPGADNRNIERIVRQGAPPFDRKLLVVRPPRSGQAFAVMASIGSFYEQAASGRHRSVTPGD